MCEPDTSIRQQFETHPSVQGLPWLTQDQLLSDKTIQMVAVESFVPRLLEFAEAAVAFGKHVHLDKPAGTDLAHFERILKAASKKSVLIQMGYMFRYNPGFDLIRQAVTDGWLGDVYAIHASMCTLQDDQKRKRLSYAPGGMMLELGCHLIDMIVLLLGTPDAITAYPNHHGRLDDTLADNCVTVFTYKERATVTVETSAMEPEAFGARRFKIAGTNGTIILSPLEPPVARIALREAAGGFPKGVTIKELPDLERHVLDFKDFARCIRGEATFAYSSEHDYEVQKTVLLASGMTVS
ncbi:MAG: hypothetical protein AMXMBFR84_37380 [Candidatus Hydrogenedentota bacterium]